MFEPMMTKLRARMEKLRLGDSLDKALDMGAIVDESQRRSVQEYVDDAKKEGAEVTDDIAMNRSAYRCIYVCGGGDN